MHIRLHAVGARAARISSLLILVASAACSSKSAAPTSPSDAGADADPPAPSDAGTSPSPGNCYPTPTETGNALNVGAFCTKNGGQCSNYPSQGLTLQCSSDLSAQGGDFCLLVGCAHDSDCGEASCCTAPAGSPIAACIPIGCFDSGVCSPVAP